MSIPSLTPSALNAVRTLQSESEQVLRAVKQEAKQLASTVSQVVAGKPGVVGTAGTSVSFSAEALHALASAGSGLVSGVVAGAEEVKDGAVALAHGVEVLGSGAWHVAEQAVQGAEHLAAEGWHDLVGGATALEKAGEAAVAAISTSAGKTASVLGDVAASATSAATFAAAAGEKVLRGVL